MVLCGRRGPSCSGQLDQEDPRSTPKAAIFAQMGKNKWYVHLSRADGASLDHIRSVLRNVPAAAASKGVNLTVGFGPTLRADLTSVVAAARRSAWRSPLSRGRRLHPPVAAVEYQRAPLPPGPMTALVPCIAARR